MPKNQKFDTDKLLESLSTPFAGGNQGSWNAIQSKIEESKTPVFSMMDYPSKKRKHWWAIAAVIALGISLFFLNTGSSSYVAEHATELILPDNTEVFLLKNAELNYNRKSAKTFVELKGGAIFKVEKGNDFTVKTNKGNISVLGTIFSVEEGNECLILKCTEGSVQFENEQQKEIVLSGEGLTIRSNSIEKHRINLLEIDARKNGVLHFNEIPFSEAVFQLELIYDIPVNFPSKYKDRSYTGHFNNLDLDKALDVLCSPMGLKYQIKEDEIQLYE